jgi:hypothetical protein
VKFSMWLLMTGLLAAVAVADPARPNIVVILADDLGYGSVGCYGADPALLKTPRIDRMANEGRRFLDANTPASICSPTRYGLLTGHYSWRTKIKFGVLTDPGVRFSRTGLLGSARLAKNVFSGRPKPSGRALCGTHSNTDPPKRDDPLLVRREAVAMVRSITRPLCGF